jgi:glycosyltransferase involved in cell wall biosynthesis
MACGSPVVISDQVNIWREVREAAAGIVIGLEPCAVAKAICRVLEDKGAAEVMGARGRVAAEENYAWSSIVKELTEVYRDLIKERRSAIGYRRSYP